MVELKEILKNKMYPEAGADLFKVAEKAILNGGTVIVNMEGVDAVPTVFMNTSFGDLIVAYGIEKAKQVFVFKNIAKSQLERIQKYFKDYERLINTRATV